MVDLTKGTTEVMEPDPALYRDYLGGAGLAARLFFDMKAWDADPLGPDNPLMIMQGPLSGTTLPGCSRLEVCARSPQTGVWGEASMGGHVSPQLRGTGYDGIIITGASDKPVYLFVTDEKVEIRDASHLWGKDSFETEELVLAETDKRARVMSIGQGGENLVKYAAVVNDRGSLAGRTGMGAVMGSKKLKAIAFRGKAKTPIADEAAYKEVRERANYEIGISVMAEGLRAFGSNVHMEMGMAMGDVPVKNWREAQWEQGMDALSGVTVAEKVMTRNHSCYACPVSCKRIVKIDAGPFAMEEGPGLEYEGAAALGTLQRLDKLDAVSKANELTDRYGIDCISTGSTIAYAIEAFENGLITKEDTGGIVLKWNDPELLVELVRMIANREGFGDQLAEGSRALSRKYGGEEYAIHVKGLEAPMHDPRALWSMALTYATSIRGACHCADSNMYAEFGNVDFKAVGVPNTKPQRREGKAAQTIPAQAYNQIAGSAVICIYAWLSMGGIEILRDLINAVTGAGYSLDDLMKMGDRIWYTKRAIGNLCGARKEEDILPERILRPHLEGLTSNLTKVLNPMFKLTAGLPMPNEKIAKFSNTLTRKFVLTNLFKILTLLGKLLPWIGGTAFSAAEAEEFRGRFVEFDYMLDEYYRLRGLDERGIPRRSSLEPLGLSDVADALDKL
jgi:aldehyde:ferredoxin oxidoreductase